MAETITIEIPISATDNTGAGVSSVQRRLTSLEKSLQKMQQQMDRINRFHGTVDINEGGNASSRIAEIEDALQKVNGASASMDITADNNASEVLSEAEDDLAKIDGDEAVMEANAENNASEVLGEAEDDLAKLDGDEAVVNVEADDAATPVIQEVDDALSALDGRNATVSIEADDNTGLFGGGSGGSSAGGGSSGIISQAAGAGASAAHGMYGRLGSAAAFAGVSLGIGSTVRSFTDFEAGMSQVAAISGATGDELGELTQKARQMGASTKFTAAQSAEAFNYMAMAGWKTEEMLSGIEGVMNLAAASGESLGTTSDIVTDALTAFGMKASDSTHFADVLAQASANANTNVGMMGESFKYIGPVAGAMGYTIEDTALALGLMANAGVKSSMAGTALRRAISSLASPTDKQAEAMEKYGISLTDGAGNIKSLNEVMDDLRTNLRGLSQDEQTAAVSDMFGTQAMAGMLAIVNASEEDYNSLSEAINNADGASRRMADTMMDNLQGSFTLLSSAWEGLQNSLGESAAPFIQDFVDGLTSSISETLSSDAFQNADLFGKINIAWDKIVAEPFTEWAGGEGKEAIGNALLGMFEGAGNVMTGQGDLTDWLGFGALVIGAEKAVTAIGSVSSAIQEMAGAGTIVGTIGAGFGTVLTGALLAAAAVYLVSSAVEALNQIEIDNNLADHFGDIALSAEEAAEAASNILADGIPIEDLTAKLHVANVEFTEADALKQKAEEELKNINGIKWELQDIDLDTSNTNLDALKEASSKFRDTLLEEIGKKEEGTKSFVDAILGDKPEAAEISSKLSEWFQVDAGEISSISESVSSLIQSSIESGVMSVETSAAISLLQGKMFEMVNGAKADQLQGKLDWLGMTSHGAALNADSWRMVTENIGSLISDFVNEDASAYQSFLGQLRTFERNDPGRHGEIEAIRNMISDAQGQMLASATTRGWGWMRDSLTEAYGSEIGQARDFISNSGVNIYDEFMNGGSYESAAMGLSQSIGNTIGSDAQGALLDRFQAMLPTVESLQSVIDNAARNSEPVAQSVMDAYNEAIELGMMAGDSDSMRQYAANMIREGYEGGFEEFKNDPQVDFGNLTDGMQQALERAFTETTQDIDYSGMLNDIFSNLDGENVDWSAVDAMLNDLGYEIEQNGDDIDIHKKADVEVEPGEVGTEGVEAAIDEAVDGTDTEADPVEAEVDIKATAGEVDDEGLEEGIREAMDGSDTETEPVEVSPDIEVSPGEIDDSELMNAIGEAVNPSEGEAPEPIEVTVPIKLTPGEVDSSELMGEISGKVSAPEEGGLEPIPVTVDVQLEKGSDNLSDVYSQFTSEVDSMFSQTLPEETPVDVSLQETDNLAAVYSAFVSKVQSTFSAPISASATVNVTLNWNITNPSASISTSSSGSTVTASIAGSAAGRYVDSPFLSWIGEDGPEYVIPVGDKRRDRGIELWTQAGEALGVFDNIQAFANGGAVGISETQLTANPFDNRKEAQYSFLEGLFGTPPGNSSPGSTETFLAAASKPQGDSGNGNKEVNVSVNMSPVIQIDGSNKDEDEIFNVMKNRIREVADDIGDEIGTKLMRAFENMTIA